MYQAGMINYVNYLLLQEMEKDPSLTLEDIEINSGHNP